MRSYCELERNCSKKAAKLPALASPVKALAERSAKLPAFTLLLGQIRALSDK